MASWWVAGAEEAGRGGGETRGQAVAESNAETDGDQLGEKDYDVEDVDSMEEPVAKYDAVQAEGRHVLGNSWPSPRSTWRCPRSTCR